MLEFIISDIVYPLAPCVWGVNVAGFGTVLIATFIVISIMILASNGKKKKKEPEEEFISIGFSVEDGSPRSTSSKSSTATLSNKLNPRYGRRCIKHADAIMAFVYKLERDHKFMKWLKEQSILDNLEKEDANMMVNQRLGVLMSLDLIRAYVETGHVYQQPNPAAMCPSVVISLIFIGQKGKFEDDEAFDRYMNYVMPQACSMIKNLSTMLVHDDNSHGLFNLPQFFNAYGEPEYSSEFYYLMRRFVELVGEGDRSTSRKVSAYLDMLDRAIAGEVTTGTTPTNGVGNVSVGEVSVGDINTTLNQLDELIGLAEVKEEVRKLTNFIKIQHARQQQGLTCPPISYHCVFTGNPGTGKTTVARIVASIYKSLGILEKGHLVETDRSGLVAEYVGQTAVKTNRIIDSALDGVLFIDEAYSLVQGTSNDFGLEAISTLLKRMEDNRDRLVVILAGYKDEMKDFIDANPGLESRFNRYINFADYSAPELLEIFRRNLAKHEYIATDDAIKVVERRLECDVETKDENFGNARHVRNLFEKTLENQATRLASGTADLSRGNLQVIEASDIPV